MFVAMANLVGQLGKRRFVERALLLILIGRVIAEAGREEEVLSASIDLSFVHESRQRYNYLKERRVLLIYLQRKLEREFWKLKSNNSNPPSNGYISMEKCRNKH